MSAILSLSTAARRPEDATEPAFYFSGIKAPLTISNPEILAIARKAAIKTHQALPKAGEASSADNCRISCTWASIDDTNPSKSCISGEIISPYTDAAFSRVTGKPASCKVKIALLAILAAATVFINWVKSSGFIAISTLFKRLTCRESRRGGKQ